MKIITVPAFDNNYIWIIYNDTHECIIIDPGETVSVLKILKKLQLSPKSILLTHNHYDHIDGVYTLTKIFPKVMVYGPEEVKNQIFNLIVVSEGDNIISLNKKIKVFNLPGHTKNHIGFYYKYNLFCGDTVFSAGCGKIATGLSQQMYKSILKIKKFPNNTLLYCGHEYTLSNINFVHSILPENQTIINYKNHVINLIKLGLPTIPTTLELELKINPFFFCDQIDVKKSVGCLQEHEEEWKIFYKLRKKKDKFNKDLILKKSYTKK